jgi:Ubiquitin-protein ligase
MASAAATSRGAMRRLMKELDTWTNVESLTEEGIERLGPVNDDELLEWEAVINGKGVGYGYDSTFPFLSLCFPPVLDPIWLSKEIC